MFRVLAFLSLFFIVACNSPATPDPIPPSPSPLSTLHSPITPSPLHPITSSSFILPPLTPPSPFSSLRVGWAYEAYPEASFQKMRADFALMRANGANAVWIGQNNPGQVDANKVEPGLSYAVYAALQDQKDPLYADARAMADA